MRVNQKACRRAAEHLYSARHLCCGRAPLDGELDEEDTRADAAMRSLTRGHLAVNAARRAEPRGPIRTQMARAERIASEARRTLAGGDMDKCARLIGLALDLLANADDLCASDGKLQG